VDILNYVIDDKIREGIKQGIEIKAAEQWACPGFIQ
jgi:hypothetical protein